MGRGVSAGGGQSSLGYLFGGGETTNSPQAPQNQTTNSPQAPQNQGQNSNTEPPQKSAPSAPVTETKQTPEVTSENHDSKTNNYFRADGQNCGNFITDRPSTKVHAAPGGGSSLGYLFGDGKK